ncbi:MAG: hypothetical protein ACRDS9_15315 [Pseudonocardiaceae bacterium]
MSTQRLTSYEDQLDIFSLIPKPARPVSEPVVHIREMPANYARVATNGHPWEWIVSRDHVIHGAGFCLTRTDAEACIDRTLDKMKEVDNHQI